MSILIDQLLCNLPNEQAELDGKWYIAKPLFIKRSFLYRLKESLKVLKGDHAFVYHYKQDEVAK